MLSLPTVLLIDDDPTANYLSKRLLRKTGIKTELLVAHNGLEALTLLQSHCQPASGSSCPTLIVLDMNMPVMNGLEFLEAFVRLPLLPAQRQHMVIILLTTTLLERDLARLQQLPVADVLHKPLTQEAVSRILQTHFDHPLPLA